MSEAKFVKLPLIPVSKTGGLVSIQQVTDTTSNEVFSFRDSTSEARIITIIYPHVGEQEQETGKKFQEPYIEL